MNSETKKNTMFKQLFNVYSRFYMIILLILLVLFFIMSNVFITNTNMLLVSKTLEKSTNDVTYKFQQIVNLAWSLTKEENVERGVENFLKGDSYKKIDSDVYLGDFFYSYWKSNLVIAKISVFIGGEVTGFGKGYKTIDFIELYDEKVQKYFQPNSGTIMSSRMFRMGEEHKESLEDENFVVITPISISGETVAFLYIEVDKEKLFTKHMEDIEYADCSSIMVSYNGECIYNDEKAFTNDDVIKNGIFENDKNIGNITNTTGESYNVCRVEKTVHGFEIVQLFPARKITTHVVPLVTMIVLLASLLLWFTLMYSKRKAKQFVEPLENLEKAMRESKIISVNESQTIEMQNIFDSYNNLLQSNKQMIEDVKQSDKKQKESEIKALLAQISPHFLYNTLNVIVFKAMNANQIEISMLVSKLAKLCRTRYNFTAEFIPLSEEIEHIEYYMQLQKECFKNKFDYSISIDEPLLGFYVPRFILQPIVENSILHGFSEISKDGRITVRTYADEDLTIEISDNGNGIDNDIIVKLNKNDYKTEKYGLRNINQRIKLLCGDDYGMTFSSNGHSRTTVKILLPIKFEA